MKILFFFVLLFIPLKVFAIDISEEQFNQINLVFTEYEKEVYTFPVVLIYDTNGELTRNFLGKDIYRIDTYTKLDHNSKQSKVSTSSLKEILDTLEVKNESEKPMILYIGMEMCPPCFTILDKFDKSIRPKIASKYEIITINLLVN